MIVLLRHAHAQGAEGRCVGRTDLPLSREGRMQAAEFAKIVSGVGFVGVWCSPLSRAVATAAPLCAALGLEPRVHEGLGEIDMGAWDGLTFESVREEFPQEYAERGQDFADFRPPGGESFRDVATRSWQVCQEMAQGPRPVLAVTHAGVIRALLCRLQSRPLSDLFAIRPAHVSCTLLVGPALALGVRLAAVPAEQAAAALREFTDS